MEKSVNWETIINEMGSSQVRSFAMGNMSGRSFYEAAICQFNGVSPEVRNLLRTRGVDEARQLARKALKRRNYY